MSKEKPRRRLRFTSVLLIIALAVAGFAYAGQLVKLQELQQKKAHYAAIYEELQAENAELLATRDLVNDETYMERLARERFKLIKPNEYLVMPAETNDEVEDYVGVKDEDLH